MSDVLDYHAQHRLRAMIRKLPAAERYQLRNIAKCGENIIRNNIGAKAAVYLLSDGERSKFFGQAHCQNPWCCPVCSARRMEEYRSKIASAIDCLNEEYFGFMMTFTIPHLSFMSCRETTDILYNTWTFFRHKSWRKDGWHPYQQFNKEVPIAHHVRVCEYTYGENGWHPHFHAIFWTKRGNESKILKWEEKLSAFWLKKAKAMTLKYWKDNGLHINDKETQEELCDRLYSKADTAKYRGIYISKDSKTGKVLESHSSDYLTGWGADRELTGNVRKEASHGGHYTPHQILEMAYTNPKYEAIYIDFCLSVTRKPVHHRVDFSQTGISGMVEEYRKEHGYRTAIVEKKTSWEVVATFDENTWFDICILNDDSPVLSNILYLAQAAEHREILYDYLESLGFRRRDILPDRSELMKEQARCIEKLFNAA